MGLQDSIRYSVGLAYPSDDHRHTSSRESLVPSPKEQARRGRARCQEISEGRHQGQPCKHSRHDGKSWSLDIIVTHISCRTMLTISKVRTNQIEIDNHVGSSFLDCFKGVDLRRTEIVCLAWPAQILAGSSFANGPVYFFQQAGLSVDVSFQLGLGVTALAFCGTCASWFVMTVSCLQIFHATIYILSTSIDGAVLWTTTYLRHWYWNLDSAVREAN